MSKVDQPESQQIVVDIGKQKRKRIRQLKRGKGPLAQKVQEGAEQVMESDPMDSRDIIPIVVLFQRS